MTFKIADDPNLQPPSGGCVLKRNRRGRAVQPTGAAAFGRLCVETMPAARCSRVVPQPPSGGCVLKPAGQAGQALANAQPPSGGCVLKQFIWAGLDDDAPAAAFGRLCVETHPDGAAAMSAPAAAFGRLCVETLRRFPYRLNWWAAAFGRLCVETFSVQFFPARLYAAAFGRLCVETRRFCFAQEAGAQPPSGGCVLKRKRYAAR